MKPIWHLPDIHRSKPRPRQVGTETNPILYFLPLLRLANRSPGFLLLLLNAASGLHTPQHKPQSFEHNVGTKRPQCGHFYPTNNFICVMCKIWRITQVVRFFSFLLRIMDYRHWNVKLYTKLLRYCSWKIYLEFFHKLERHISIILGPASGSTAY